ncbi:MAG: NUDIX domain-containing protein [Candidatus Ornithospirochaeta sp.]
MENKKEMLELGEKMVSSKEVYDGKLLHVYKDMVVLPNGRETARELIRHNGACAVVPLLDNGNVIAERQFRYPFGEVVTEIPAGKLDSADEDHLEAAKRELREETGYEADEWIEIGSLRPSVAYTTEVIWLYLARGLKRGERELDEDEFLNVFEIPLEEFVEKVMSGEITDSKTQIAILKTARLLGK